MSMETDRIEADLDQSRHRLNDTLEALGHKLSPGQILDEALGLAKGQAGTFTAKLGRDVRDNPLPTLLIGAGIAMLVMNRNRQSHQQAGNGLWNQDTQFQSLEDVRSSTPRMESESDEDYDTRVHSAYAKALNLKQKAGEASDAFMKRIKETVSGIQHAASSATRGITGAMSGAKHAVSGAGKYAANTAHKLGEGARDARHNAANYYQESPLVVGAVALAVGALIGSFAPLTDPEREGLHGVADKAMRAGADFAERGARMVDQRVDGAMH
jgi:ElaB/YqjD/DUF883 family membrane-anchored ribosome-binding protein